MDKEKHMLYCGGCNSKEIKVLYLPEGLFVYCTKCKQLTFIQATKFIEV